MEEDINVSGSVDNEDTLVEGVNVDRFDGTTNTPKAGVAENVEDTVCPWQRPLVNETSSIAMSPLNEDPRIPSNVTWMKCRGMQSC